MNYKEKYEMALETIQEILESGSDSIKMSRLRLRLQSVFPEIRESKDERIRKEIIKFLELPHPQFVGKRHQEDWLAWLEKQGNNINCIYNKELSELLHIVICRYVNDPDISYTERENVSKKIFPYVELLEKQCKQKPQRMISAEAKEAMYNKPADTVEPKFKIGDSIKTANEEPLTITEITDNGYWSEDLFICNFDDAAKWELVEQKPADKVEQKCEESKTKVFDAPTPFEDKLYVFVAACEFLAIPSKIEFILEHSQEILDAAREQIGKERSSTWSEKDEEMRLTVLQDLQNIKESYPNVNVEPEFNWLKSLKDRYTWKPSDERMAILYKYAEQNNYDGSILTSLYNELKKLREE